MPVCRRKQSARLAAHVELAAADVDLAFGRLAEGDDAGVETMDQSAEGHKIQRALFGDIQAMFHNEVGAGSCTKPGRVVSQKVDGCAERVKELDELHGVHELGGLVGMSD